MSEAASQAQRDNRAAANVRTRESRSEQLVQQAQERDAARAARMRDRNQSPTLPPLQQPSTRRGAAQSPAQAASSQEPATRRDLHIQRREAASASRAAASRTRTPLSEYTHPSAAAGASNSNASSVHNRSNVSNVSNVSNTSSASKVSNVSNVTNVTNISNVSNVSNVSSVTNLSTFSGSKFHQPSFFLPPHKKSPLFLASHKPKTSLFFGIGSGKTSFFFSYSSSPLFFKPKHAWYPTWSHWHGSSWSWWAWHKPYHSWCPWWSHPHTSLRWTTWPRTTILHTHTYSVLPTTHVIYQPATTVVSKPKPIVIEQPACPYTHREAWEFLAQGPSHLDQAVDAFTCLAQEHPYDGITVVGLSLATARAGDFDKAAQLMRFAARVDVESLRHVPADRRIDDIIVDLVGAYSQLMHAPAREIDALFMIAALRTILHDAGGAHFTIGQAIQKGDEDASAFALRDLLVKLLSEELFPGP